MNNSTLPNWQVEKEFERIDRAIKFKSDLEDEPEKLQWQLAQANHKYDGDDIAVYVFIIDQFHKHFQLEKAQKIFDTFFSNFITIHKGWKLGENQFTFRTLKEKFDFIIDKVIAGLNFLPTSIINFIKDPSENLPNGVLMEKTVERFSYYKKEESIIDLTDKVPYKGSDLNTLFRVINAVAMHRKEELNNYLDSLLERISTANEKFSLVMNIDFNDELFHNISVFTLEKILNFPGIDRKFNSFIKLKSFMEKFAETSADAKVLIDISNKLVKEGSPEMAVSYAHQAVFRDDFEFDMLPQILCVFEPHLNDGICVAEELIRMYLNGDEFMQVYKLIDLTYAHKPQSVESLDTALKYSRVAVKLAMNALRKNPSLKTKVKDGLIKHLTLLTVRAKSINKSSGGIIQEDRYLKKADHALYLKEINSYRAVIINLEK